MDLTTLAIIRENPLALGVVSVFLLIGVAIKVAKSIYDFHDEYVLHRRYKRISLFLDECRDDDVLKQFLSTLKEAEIFRISTGIKTSPLRAKALMKLFSAGNVSWVRLKGISQYLAVEGGSQVKLSISNYGKFFAIYSYVSGIVIFILGIFMMFLLTISKSGIVDYLLAAAVIFFSSILARLMCADYKNLKRAKNLDLEVNQQGQGIKESIGSDSIDTCDKPI